MGEFDDKSGKGFQDDWNWPTSARQETRPPELPNIVGKLVLLGGVALGIYAYFAAHWNLGSK